MMKQVKKYGILTVQLIASGAFAGILCRTGVVPSKYLIAILALIILLWLLGALICMKTEKHIFIGNLYSFLMTVVLVYGSVNLFQTIEAMKAISSHGDEKIDEIVVAVLLDDPAENIKDAADYRFGVQYVLKGDEIRQAVTAIEQETEHAVKVTEYKNLQEQFAALYSREADAIVFNEAYLSLLEEETDIVTDKIKIIYSYSVEGKIEINMENDEKDEDEMLQTGETFAVYISGIDVFGSIKKTSRSDVNIIAFVNPQSKQILLVTTPRDYYVPLPGISGGRKDKLTHAGIYGVDVSMATLEQLYDTRLDYYARVNFTSLIEIVDALGGVDVDSEVAFKMADMDVVKGRNHFNGEQALAFSRERYHVAGGDFQRGKDQQAVITAMIRKILSPAILTGAGEIIQSVSKSVDTNMSYEEMQRLIRQQLESPASWNIKSVAAEGRGDRQVTFSMPGRSLYVAQPVMTSVEKIRKEITALQNGELLDDSTIIE